MKYQQREQDGYTIIELAGEVDLSCSPDARRQILAVIDAGKNLLIDLSGVTYIDSSGVASLVEGYQAARKKQLRFGLVAVSDSAMSVFTLARLDQVFPIHATVEARIEADG
jgi:anti-sigma B factor antagonist